MGYLDIECATCGGHWNVYHTVTNWTDPFSRTCPHCLAEIDAKVWEDSVLPAFGAMCDANDELLRVAWGGDAPLFRMHYAEDQDMPDRHAAALAALQARIDDLERHLADKIDEGGDNALAVALMKGEI